MYLFNLDVPGRGNIFVQTTHNYSLKELKEKLHQMNIDEDLKDDISFCHNMCQENYQMKFFFIKHGMKVIEMEW